MNRIGRTITLSAMTAGTFCGAFAGVATLVAIGVGRSSSTSAYVVVVSFSGLFAAAVGAPAGFLVGALTAIPLNVYVKRARHRCTGAELARGIVAICALTVPVLTVPFAWSLVQITPGLGPGQLALAFGFVSALSLLGGIFVARRSLRAVHSPRA